MQEPGALCPSEASVTCHLAPYVAGQLELGAANRIPRSRHVRLVPRPHRWFQMTFGLARDRRGIACVEPARSQPGPRSRQRRRRPEHRAATPRALNTRAGSCRPLKDQSRWPGGEPRSRALPRDDASRARWSLRCQCREWRRRLEATRSAPSSPAPRWPGCANGMMRDPSYHDRRRVCAR